MNQWLAMDVKYGFLRQGNIDLYTFLDYILHFYSENIMFFMIISNSSVSMFSSCLYIIHDVFFFAHSIFLFSLSPHVGVLHNTNIINYVVLNNLLIPKINSISVAYLLFYFSCELSSKRWMICRGCDWWNVEYCDMLNTSSFRAGLSIF